MPQFLPALARHDARVMMFVDGENLAIRYKEMLANSEAVSHVVHVEDVFVWTRYASRLNGPQEYVRRYYYTSSRGDSEARASYEEQLRSLGIEAPRVFPRKRNGRSKRVDITLATEMLTHAHRKNFDIAVLVAGDEDYVPLIEAVKAEGRRVAVWFLGNGLSPALRNAADFYWDIGEVLFQDSRNRNVFDVLYG
ncbi:MAG: NYN domain-containing protein [Moraxellaceae bacterium]|nr:NYN domain-containing protein [Moraxellaceae bacterium]